MGPSLLRFDSTPDDQTHFSSKGAVVMAEETPLQGQVTKLLSRINEGDASAKTELYRIVYGELRVLARKLMSKERPGHILQPTALVHELYLRINAGEGIKAAASLDFFRIVAHAMKHILVDQARQRNAAKRQGIHVELEDQHAGSTVDPTRMIDLRAALRRFSGIDGRAAQIFELHYLSGQDVPRLAEAFRLSTRQIQRHLNVATMWIKRQLVSTNVSRTVGKD
jgi:RNA polymerase sigma factor (TIGR02999 family)